MNKFLSCAALMLGLNLMSWPLSLLADDKATLSASADMAPAFELVDQDGEKVTLENFKGKTVVLEWTNPECPFVKRHYKENTMEQLAEKFGSDVTWLAVNSTHFHDSAANKKWRNAQGLKYPVLNDQAGTVGKLYGAKTTPHMFVIDPAGKVAYRGAIDDDPQGENSKRVNYVENALTESLAGKPVQLSETTPYGCSVKYAG